MAGFDADKAVEEASVDYPPYPFTWKGEEHHLPHMGMMSSDDAVRLAESMALATNLSRQANAIGGSPDDEQEAAEAAEEAGAAFLSMLEVLDDVVGGDEAAAQALREIPSAVLAQLLMEWEGTCLEQMGDLGKEPSEPSAPNRSARRSQSTSKAKAKTSTSSKSARSAA